MKKECWGDTTQEKRWTQEVAARPVYTGRIINKSVHCSSGCRCDSDKLESASATAPRSIHGNLGRWESPVEGGGMLERSAVTSGELFGVSSRLVVQVAIKCPDLRIGMIAPEGGRNEAVMAQGGPGLPSVVCLDRLAFFIGASNCRRVQNRKVEEDDRTCWTVDVDRP